MTYRLDRRVAVLEFEEDGLEGAEVRCRVDVPLRVLLDVQASLANGELRNAISTFGTDILLGWTIEEDGELLPANADGMLTLPVSIAVRLVGAWISAAVQLPLGQPPK